MRKILIVCMAAASLGLGGCASFIQGSGEDANANVDMAQVAAIEQVARQRGVVVLWKQYPQKRVTVSQ